MGLLSSERGRALLTWPRLIASRGTQRTLHLCHLLASVQFAGLPRITLADFRRQFTKGAPSPDRVVLHPDLNGMGSGSTAEMASLASLVAARQPRRLLEFGTCDGCSTWHLWANAPADARITTIDLPAGTHVEGSSDLGLQGVSRRPYLPADSRIRLVEMDSRQVNPADIGPIDFCFVDAGHTYECVKSDSEKALAILQPGGLLVWHDASWLEDGYGVNRYLKELRASGRDVKLLDAGPYDYCALAVLAL